MNRMPGWVKIGVLTSSVLVVALVATLLANRLPESPVLADGPDVEDVAPVLDERIVVGGIPRMPSDVSLGDRSLSEQPTIVKKRQGFSEPVDPEANASVVQLAAALEDRTDPAAFSSFAPPSKFDLEKYRENPEEYLTKIEPSRVFAPAQPGEDVPVIRSDGKRFHRLKQGESVRLRVDAKTAGAPIAFSSGSLGTFENKLTSITVAADDQGIAEAVFTASGGTIDLVRVLAASPMASGQVEFTIDVAVPE